MAKKENTMFLILKALLDGKLVKATEQSKYHFIRLAEYRYLLVNRGVDIETIQKKPYGVYKIVADNENIERAKTILAKMEERFKNASN